MSAAQLANWSEPMEPPVYYFDDSNSRPSPPERRSNVSSPCCNTRNVVIQLHETSLAETEAVETDILHVGSVVVMVVYCGEVYNG